VVETQERQAWLTERKKGIGGSDVASLFGVGWGCKRRLWYDKRSVPEDYPREENAAMELGQVLEPYFAEKYAEKTGRFITLHHSPFVHPDHEELRVNVDRLIWESDSKRAPLEVKSCGRAAFYKYKREGLPEDYILQLQHAMLVTGATWGSFAIGSRDSGELLYWDVDRSEQICNEILVEGPKFWAMVENGPAPDALEPDDPRCSKCAWRRTCQGNALIQVTTGDMPQAEHLRPLLAEFDERKALFEQAEELLEETKEEFKTELGDQQAVMIGERKVYYRPQEGRTLYRGKELLLAYQNLLTEVLVGLANRDLTVESVMKAAPPPETFLDKSKPSRPLRIF
jgi:putative phage-type endonuclease